MNVDYIQMTVLVTLQGSFNWNVVFSSFLNISVFFCFFIVFVVVVLCRKSAFEKTALVLLLTPQRQDVHQYIDTARCAVYQLAVCICTSIFYISEVCSPCTSPNSEIGRQASVQRCYMQIQIVYTAGGLILEQWDVTVFSTKHRLICLTFSHQHNPLFI